jgi:carboxypeptidase family protein
MARPIQAVGAIWICVLAAGLSGQQPTATGVVAGQVIDVPTGRPVGGAVVILAVGAPPAAVLFGPGPPAQSRRAVAVSNAEGRFVFRDVPAGDYSLTSTFEGYAPGATGRRRPGGPGRAFTLTDGARLTDAVISMWRLAAISGVVRDDRGEPAVGVTVWAMPRTTIGGRFELTFNGGRAEATDDRGHYRLHHLMPGNYVIAIGLSTQSASVSTVDAYQAAVTSGSAASVMSEWRETGALQISRDGLDVGGWKVFVSEGRPQPLPGPRGTLLVHPTVFHANVTSPSDATVLTLASGDDRTGIDLTLPLVAGVRVSGVLVGPSGPAANSGIRLIPATSDGPVYDIPAAYCTTDSAGRFAFLGVPPGSYAIRAYRVPLTASMMRPPPPAAAGALPITTSEPPPPPRLDPPTAAIFSDVPIAVGSTHIDGVTVTLTPGARLSGRVVFDGTTAPPPAARLQQMSALIRPISGQPAPGTDARVDANGQFTTLGYPPGRYSITVTPPGPEWTLASVRIGAVDAAGQAFALGSSDVGDVVVTFVDKVITLSGTVSAAASGGNPEATVVLFPVDYQTWLATGMSSRRLAASPASATGAYQLRVPLPGDYLVVAVPPDVAPEVDRDFVTRFAPSAVRVSLASGETKTQALTVSRPR